MLRSFFEKTVDTILYTLSQAVPWMPYTMPIFLEPNAHNCSALASLLQDPESHQELEENESDSLKATVTLQK